MKTIPWTANKVALAYDAKFHVVEEARSEYGRAIKDLLNEIAKMLEMRAIVDGKLNEVTNHSFTNDENLGKCNLEYSIVGLSKETKSRVLARFSAPWAGPSGFLQLAVASGAAPERINKLRNHVAGENWVRQHPPAWEGLEGLESDWIFGYSLKLSEALIASSATEIMAAMLQLAHHSVFEIDLRMEALLKKCKQRLQNDQRLAEHPENKIEGVLDWENQRYVQVGKFWLGYQWSNGDLMFGDNHQVGEFKSQLLAALSAKITLAPSVKYKGCSAGTIMDSERLSNAKDDEILHLMMLAFETYIQLMVGFPKPVL